MIYPEGTKVIVIPDEVEEMTKGGLFVPDTVRGEQQHAVTRGEVHALGPDAEVYFSNDAEGDEKHAAKPGDRVMFVKFAGASLRKDENGKRVEYRILQDHDIVCLIPDAGTEMPDTRKPMVK